MNHAYEVSLATVTLVSVCAAFGLVSIVRMWIDYKREIKRQQFFERLREGQVNAVHKYGWPQDNTACAADRFRSMAGIQNMPIDGPCTHIGNESDVEQERRLS